ncbi:MAG: hypothetical protein ABI333_14600 [bacterium]
MTHAHTNRHLGLRRFLGCAIAASVLCCASTVHPPAADAAPADDPLTAKPPPNARPAPEPVKPWAKGVPAARRSEALRLYKQGNKFFEDSQYAQALAEYRKAVELWDHPAIRYNIAVCYVNLERPLAAHRNLLRALRFGKAPLKAHYKQAQTYLRLLTGRLARLEVRCSVPGARVTLDGRLLFVAPGSATRTLIVGKHVLVATKPKHVTETRTVSLFPRKRVKVTLAPLPITKVFTLKRRWKRWIPWTILGIGVAVAATGIPLAFMADSTFKQYNKDFERECPDGCLPADRSTALQDLRSRGELERGFAITMLGLGGAVLATGITLVLLNLPRTVRTNVNRKHRDTTATAAAADRLILHPAVGPGQVSLTTGIRF